MRNTKLGRFFLYILIQAPILFLCNMIGNIYPLKENIIMSICASIFSALLFQPMNRLILYLKQKFFLKNTLSK